MSRVFAQISRVLPRLDRQRSGRGHLPNLQDNQHMKNETMPHDSDSGNAAGPERSREIPPVRIMSRFDTRSKDYPALIVFCLALVLLLLMAVLLWRDMSVRGPSILEDLKDKVRTILGSGPYSSKPEILRKGYRLYKQQDYEAAFKALSKAVKSHPGDPDGHYLLGRTLIMLERYEQSLEAFLVSADLDPNDPQTQANLGWLYGRRSEYQKGIRHLSRTIELDPDNGWAYYNRGRMHHRAGREEMARRDAEKACELGFKLGCTVTRQDTS